MAEYGREAQTLDQTFPQRLISATRQLAEDELQERMTLLDKKTAEIKAIGILDETPAHPLGAARLRDMDATVSRAMTLYVQDTEHKLEALVVCPRNGFTYHRRGRQGRKTRDLGRQPRLAQGS